MYRFMSTCTIEEKIIQRQLSKEGLQNIVEDKEQVNTFSTDELKALFSRRTDSRSDTHDTLRCKRCSNVKPLDSTHLTVNREFTVSHKNECSEFISRFIECIKNEAQERDKTEYILPYIDDLHFVRNQLQNDYYTSLPNFSREIREVVSGADRQLEELKILKPFSILHKFVYLWGELVPKLSLLNSTQCVNGETSVLGEDEEWVPQEGCPEEEDFNRWSHHCSAVSTDDECLRRATEGDSSVSFIFGLEINWDLLQARQDAQRESELIRKEQMKEAIDALNKRRRESGCLTTGPVEVISGSLSLPDSSTIREPITVASDLSSEASNCYRKAKSKGMNHKKIKHQNLTHLDNVPNSVVRRRKRSIIVLDDSEDDRSEPEVRCESQVDKYECNSTTTRKLTVNDDIVIDDEILEKENTSALNRIASQEWNCSICTFINSSADGASCIMCGYVTLFLYILHSNH